jgi:hypothetical protein
MWFFYGRLIGSFICLYGRQGFPTKKKSQFLFLGVEDILVLYKYQFYNLLFCMTRHCRAWLRGDDDLVISRINNRIGAVTGLDMNTAEDLQVYLTFNNIWVISHVYYWSFCMLKTTLVVSVLTLSPTNEVDVIEFGENLFSLIFFYHTSIIF